jgi:phenylacetate-CoA ligase
VNSFHPASAPDFVPAPRLRALQLERLRAIVARAHQHVPLFYRRMEERHFTPRDLLTLDDIAQLPFTMKSDLRDTYPYGLFASPMEEVVRVHASSGTTGKPIVVGYTREDIEVWTSSMVRCLAATGLRKGDVVQNAYGYGLFTGGLGAHYGAEALGATVIPISGGNTERQLTVLQDFGVTAICCTPSYLVHLIECAKEKNIDLSRLRVALLGAEPWSEAMRKHIQDASRIAAHDIYGLSEIVGPGVAIECPERNGLHILEDHYYPEIIDPQTGQVLPEGSEGELVFTTLSKQAMPLIRYRTRDITAFIPGPCPCGRTLRRMRRISRRSDDMMIIRGVNVFPSQIEAAFLTVDGTMPHYQIVLTRMHSLDEMEVQLEVTPEIYSDKETLLPQLQRKVEKAIDSIVGVRARVTLVAPQSLQRSEGKAKRVKDLRAL